MENMRSSAVRFSEGALRDAWQDADCARSVCCRLIWRKLSRISAWSAMPGSPVRQFRRRVDCSNVLRGPASSAGCCPPAFATPVLERLEQDRFSELAGGSYRGQPGARIDAAFAAHAETPANAFHLVLAEGAASAVCMTHDVETPRGGLLRRSDGPYQRFGMAASFQVVPEDRYEVSDKYWIRSASAASSQCSDLNHDGRLYNHRDEFARRAVKINEYGRRWGLPIPVRDLVPPAGVVLRP